jgi:protein-S-isoprenylcysteine O-methyltransferase Ste14
MSRVLALLYGAFAYVLFLLTFLYLIGFVADVFVPKSVDRGAPPNGETAVLIDLLLIALFGVQHSVMARPRFKAWLTRYVPKPIERSTFVLVTCVVFALMFWLWEPLPGRVWSIDGALAWVILTVAAAGWALVLLSTFVIDHFELFGLKQVIAFALRREPVPARFAERSVYRWVRHPLMLGFLVAMWATPVMTLGHLIFAAGYTVYVLIALQIEERDLVAMHGADYRDYRRRVPMLLPLPAGRRDASAADVG